MRNARLTAALVVASLLWLGASAVEAQVRTEEYEVKKGDTCESIADEFYDHEGGCALIEKYNSEEGEPPEFEPGEVLQLPKKVTKAEARVDRKDGSVRARDPDRSWHSAEVGERLFRAWRVNTLESARARLFFRDRSRLKMRQQTLVIIYGGSREKAERKRESARLVEGKLRSKLSELSGDETKRVSSPGARAEMKGGNVLFDVEEDGTTRVANHGGPPVEVSGRGNRSARQSVPVPEGKGSKVVPGSAPSPPQELPPAPTWKTTSGVLSLGGEPVDISAVWKPVDEASEYFVELAAGREGIEMVESAYVPAKVTRLEVRDVEPGTYYATVSTIDSDEFESIPSDRVTLRVWPIEYDEVARLESDEDPTFVLGSELSAPGDVECSIDGESFDSTVMLKTPGERKLQCRTGEDGGIRPRTVRVQKPSATVGGPGATDETVRVRARGYASVHLDFEPRAPKQLEVATQVDGEQSSTSATAVPVTETRWRVKLDGSALDGESAALVARTGGGVELARVPVRVVGERQQKERRPRREVERGTKQRIRTGFRLGGLVERTAGGTGFGGGGRIFVSYLHSSPFGMEFHVGTSWADRRGWRMEGRSRALVRFETGRFRPYVGGGFGVDIPWSGRARPFFDIAGGVGWEPGGRWTLRATLESDVSMQPGGGLLWRPGVGFELLIDLR